MLFDVKIPSPIFEGSTGGWLRSGIEEEIYSIVWNTPKENSFEMPTGGAAKMRLGDNLVYFARKEQCLALGAQLRTFKITNYKIFRIFPTGEVHFLHPKDGFFPEKVNSTRIPINSVPFQIIKKSENT
jgi:photosystem I subunit 2